MISSVVIEDLAVAAEWLKHCCEKSGEVEVKAVFACIKEATLYLNENKIDLIFLDVEMPDESTGFDLLDRISYKPKVILTTSKTEYAYSAFEYNVSDFLKKPFSYKRFEAALEKVKASIANTTVPSKEDDHFFIKSDGKIIKLMNESILYVESLGDYVKFVTTEKKYVSLNTIKCLEEKMNAETFLKTHRSFIVNIKKVTNIKDSSVFILDQEIPISKANRSEVMKRIHVI